MARLGRAFPNRAHLGKAIVGIQVITASGDFTFVAQATTYTFECWGGGGGGTSGGINGADGAGGGAYAKLYVTGLTIGNTYNGHVAVSQGGGFDGDDSWVINNTTVLAKGGKTAGAGGLASACIGDVKFSGGNGGTKGTTGGGGGGESASSTAAGNNGSNGSVGTGGAGGTGTAGGDGGKGGDAAQAGAAGVQPGGGGGGGGSSSVGGSDAAGPVILTWPGTAPASSTPPTVYRLRPNPAVTSPMWEIYG